MSLYKNLKTLSKALPKPVITWDKVERITRNQEIWNDKDSIVHRLPEFYKERYWKNILKDKKPVHYIPPRERYSWDEHRQVMVENEIVPIEPIYPPEADQGLWGGEGVVKGYKVSKPFVKKKILPRHWIPHFWFPTLKDVILYSEILNKHMKITVTESALRQIDECFGLDYYLLKTDDIDLCSKLALKLKREILITLAKEEFYEDNEERKNYIITKYNEFKIPLEEAEWIGLDLNEACKKLQDIEDSQIPISLKYRFEKELVEDLKAGIISPDLDDEYKDKKPSKSLFGEKLFGGFMKDLNKKVKIGV
uniref:Large ribosomal subunit protein bL28m n=1 Tax=Parastrongyloides trichosuri TaxID=131310 RepID=A0A0N4ZPW4_PARTI